jgi:hypothetical protein
MSKRQMTDPRSDGSCDEGQLYNNINNENYYCCGGGMGYARDKVCNKKPVSDKCTNPYKNTCSKSNKVNNSNMSNTIQVKTRLIGVL